MYIIRSVYLHILHAMTFILHLYYVYIMFILRLYYIYITVTSAIMFIYLSVFSAQSGIPIRILLCLCICVQCKWDTNTNWYTNTKWYTNTSAILCLFVCVQCKWDTNTKGVRRYSGRYSPQRWAAMTWLPQRSEAGTSICTIHTTYRKVCQVGRGASDC